MQLVSEEITETNSSGDIGKHVAAQRSAIETDQPPTIKRKIRATSKCRNRTREMCNYCRATVCGKRAIKLCPNCVD